MPVLDRRADDQHLVPQVALGHLRPLLESCGTVEETIEPSMSPNDSPRSAEQVGQPAPSSSPVDSRTVANRQCSATGRRRREDAEVGLGVADVDDQQHGAEPYEPAALRRAGTSWPLTERRERIGQPRPVGQRQLGVELEQRHEHEPPRADLRVRQRQPV